MQEEDTGEQMSVHIAIHDVVLCEMAHIETIDTKIGTLQ